MIERKKYLWVVRNPLGTDVALKQSTYDTHIMDESRDEKERANLELVAQAAKSVITQPRFIYWEKNKYKQRHRYIDLIAFEELLHIQSLVVVVDTDRSPHEIVTWMIKRSLKQEILKGGGIIYDSSQNKR